ncbi:unnamed protein product [Penicillium olsonii]|nr:unnamed protein product [Penicillium olsonii]
MSQRQKVLDTESTTAKFLYAIIKQTDLKSIDWNRVASDLQVSNGHAARMRYSRFRQQMEGTLAPRAKRKPKKAKVMDPPTNLQTDLSTNPSLMVPPVPAVNSTFPGNPFIKPEPGTQSNSAPGHMLYGSQSMQGNTMPGQQRFPLDYCSMQFQQAVTMQPGASSSSDTVPSSSMNTYPIEAMQTNYPYLPPGMPSSFGVQDLGMQMPFPDQPSGMTWGQQAPSALGEQFIKPEEVQQGASMMEWKPMSPFLSDAIVKSEDQQQVNSVGWESRSFFQQDAPVTMSDNRGQIHTTFQCEPSTSLQGSTAVKPDEQQHGNLAAVWGNALPASPDVPVSCGTEQPPKEEKISWVSMPPPPCFANPSSQTQAQGRVNDNLGLVSLPPQEYSPAEVEVENPSTALVLWRPPALSQQLLPEDHDNELQSSDPTIIWPSFPLAINAIDAQVINIDSNEPNGSAENVKRQDIVVELE